LAGCPHPLYRHQEVAPGVWWVVEKYFESSWNLANIYFIRGTEADLLIDTGVGVHQLPAFLASSGLRPEPAKPLSVVLTHLHFDHSGGAHQFPLVHAHTREAAWVARGDPYMCASWVTPQEVVPKPAGWRAEEYRVQECQVEGVEEGHLFHLGDRQVEVLHLPGHSPGSLGLIDRGSGVVATGDTLYHTSHGLIDWYPGSSSSQMLASVQRLRDLGEAGSLRTVLPGHNQVGDWASVRGAADSYIAGHGLGRRARKVASRSRAGVVLGARSLGLGMASWREAIAN